MTYKFVTGVTAKLPGSTPPPKKHKYNAQPTTVDDSRFDSKAEAQRYGELKLLEEAGAISKLAIHPRFELLPRMLGRKLRKVVYEADFSYQERGQSVVEDVKGVETAVWRLKRNLFLRKYPHLELRVIKKGP